MADRLRLGVVGAGRIAETYIDVASEDDSVELVAVADASADARAAAAARVEAATFGSTREMMAESDLDAALVLVPPAAHEEIAIKLLAGGVHVLCEKPRAPTTAAAERMTQAAAAADRQLVMASKFRFVPDMLEAQRLIAAEVIGAPTLFECAFCSVVDMTGRWNSDPSVSGGGVVIDNGSHAVDIARMLLGPLERVLAQFAPRIQPTTVEDTARVLFEATSGCAGMIELSWSIARSAEHYVVVHGSGGELQVGWRGSRYRQTGGAGWVDFGRGYDKRAAFAAQLQNFVGVVQGDQAPLVSCDDALASVQAVDAAYRSERSGAWVAVEGHGG